MFEMYCELPCVRAVREEPEAVLLERTADRAAEVVVLDQRRSAAVSPASFSSCV